MPHFCLTATLVRSCVKGQRLRGLTSRVPLFPNATDCIWAQVSGSKPHAPALGPLRGRNRTDSSGAGRVVNPIEERRGGRGRTVCAHQGPVQGNRGQPLGHTVPPAGGSLNHGCLTVITPIKKTNGFNLKDITLTAGFVPANGAWLSCSEQAPETGMGAHRAASWGQA